jgi:hypothetical protein
MLKELQEKLQLEIKRMEDKLVGMVSAEIKNQKIDAKVSEDLSSVAVIMSNERQEDGRITQNEYKFTLEVREGNKKSKLYSALMNVLLLVDKKVVGSYTVASVVDVEVINFVFSVIESFRESELNAAPTE